MKTCPVLGVASILLAVPAGCGVFLPSGLLSGLVLNPDTSCDQLARSLRLGDLPDAASPADVGFQFQPVAVKSANGRMLAGWFIPAQRDGQLTDQPAGTVLVMHGTDGSQACALPWAAVAALNGWHAVVFDYQGFGDSEGAADIATQLDDSEAMLNWIISDSGAARQVVHLLGVSLGTGPAQGLAALRARPQVRSVALDGSYDPVAMLERVESSIGPVLPLLGVSARLGFGWLFEMRGRLTDVAVPAMFIHASRDRITPLSGAQTMFDLSGSPAKTFWRFDGLTHVQPLFIATSDYVSLLVTFWRDPAGQPDPSASDTDASIRLPSF
ncbi:MAG: alpha/beta hydrolase [Phycisphaerae bacterium]